MSHRPTVTLDQSTISAVDEAGSGESEMAVLPEKIGRFTVTGTLGVGGMGTVFEARDAALGRRVAIKVMHSDVADGHDRGQSLRREARALARLSHPNVVQVFEVGEHDGHMYVAMERVVGGTFADWRNAAERSFEEIRDMLCAAGRGLEAAHARGLLHRDFKPENVLVGDDGRPRVVDFGLVRRLSPSESASVSSTSLGPSVEVGPRAGTVPFMAPEQLIGLPLDARADQFAFCVVFYEAVYGRHPFEAPGVTQIGLRIIAGEAATPPPRPDVPAWLPEVLARGMAQRPEERFADMGALLRALQPGQSVVSPPLRSSRWRRYGPMMALAAAVGLVTLGEVARRAGSGERSADPAAAPVPIERGPGSPAGIDQRLSPSQRAVAVEVRAAIDAAKRERDRGRPEHAVKRLHGVVERSGAMTHPALRAELLLALGRAQLDAGRLSAAERSLVDAFWIARGSDSSELAVDAGVLLIDLVERQGRLDDAKVWARHTRTLVDHRVSTKSE